MVLSGGVTPRQPIEAHSTPEASPGGSSVYENALYDKEAVVSQSGELERVILLSSQDMAACIRMLSWKLGDIHVYDHALYDHKVAAS